MLSLKQTRVAAPPLRPIEALLATWRRQRLGNKNVVTGPYLSVSREMGTDGGEIARRVANRLGWKILDREILDILAAQYDTSHVVLEFVDETKVGWLSDWLSGWVEGHGFSQLSYVHRLSRLFNAAARRGKVVIVGRGSRFVLPERYGLSVRIVAPLEFRARQVMYRQRLSLDKARKFVEQIDSNRTAFVQKYFHHDVTNPHLHDLVINVERLGHDSAVDVIYDAVQTWMNRLGGQIPGNVGAQERIQTTSDIPPRRIGGGLGDKIPSPAI